MIVKVIEDLKHVFINHIESLIVNGQSYSFDIIDKCPLTNEPRIDTVTITKRPHGYDILLKNYEGEPEKSPHLMDLYYSIAYAYELLIYGVNSFH